MGHKVEAREVKIAALITLLSAFLVKGFTALAAYLVAHHPDLAWQVKPGAWLNNPSYHGFSEILYEYTSANANNGSGFEGLADNNVFWNISTGIVLLLALPPLVASDSFPGALQGSLCVAGLLLVMAGLWELLRGVEGMGLGDVKMLAMIGAFLGVHGVVVTLVFASLAGSLVGITLLARGAIALQGKLPFGLFLALGAAVALFAGEPLARAYLALL